DINNGLCVSARGRRDWIRAIPGTSQWDKMKAREGVSAMRIARSTGAVSGVLIALLGIWGALIPFVGPYFDYSFGINTSWHYSTDRLWLNIIPGLVAMLAGILLLAARTRPAGVFAGWVAVVAGAWFAIGPPVSVSWEHGLGPIGPPLGGSTRQMLEL